MAVDIAAQTLKVGNALTSVKIEDMILSLAKGIAWGQYELDKVGVEITKLMGVPGTVSIGDEQISMLDAGFIPSFYHFVDTILEIKMEVNIREEIEDTSKTSVSQSGSTEVTKTASMETKASGGYGPFKAEMTAKMGYSATSKSAWARSMDASHSQKFSQDLSASSLMRTKLVPVPAPEVLVERIRILLEKLKREAEEDQKKDENKGKDFATLMMEKVQAKLLARMEKQAVG